MPDIRHKRGTRAALNALASSNGLKPGQIYVITDESRLAVALTVSTYQAHAKEGEGGSGGGAGYYVGASAPADPVANPLWFNLTTGAFLAYVDDGSSAQWVEAGANLIPTGGTTGQVLSKTSATDFEMEWVTPTSGSSQSAILSWAI